MQKALFLVAAVLAGTPDLAPVGPISAKLSESYSDLNKVQDAILAAQKVEDKEIDKLPQSPNDPWDAAPSSLLQKGDGITDNMETKGTIDFGDLDKLQTQLSDLHTKMGGELTSLKATTEQNEDFAKKEAAEAAEADSLLAKDSAAPSSLIETNRKRTLKATVEKLLHIATLLEPMKKSLIQEIGHPVTKNEKVESEIALRHLFAMDALAMKSAKLMDELKASARTGDESRIINSVMRLKKGMRVISKEAKVQLHDLQAAHVKAAGLRSHALFTKLHSVLRPLQEKLRIEMSDKSPLGMAKARSDAQNLVLLEGVLHQAEHTIAAANHAAHNAHNPLERHEALSNLHNSMESIEDKLRFHLRSLKERRAMAPGSLVEAQRVTSEGKDFPGVGFNKIQENLKALQGNINGQINTLKSQVAQESQKQTQQLDNVLGSNGQDATNAAAVAQDTYQFGVDTANLRTD